MAAPSGVFPVWYGTALGFFKQMNSPDGYDYFSGIALGTDGTVYLVEDGHPNSRNALTSVAWPSGTLGAFNASAFYTVTYTVNTSTGGIANLSVSNGTATDSADYVPIDNYGANFFTVANTAFAGLAGSGTGGQGLIQNFNIAAVAFTSTWTGGASTTNWADSGNWTNGVPGSTTGTSSTDTAVFSQSVSFSPMTIDANRNVMNITFDTSSVSPITIGTTGGNSLLLSGGGTVQTTSSVSTAQIINAPLVLEGNYTFTSNASGSNATLTFGGRITPAATSGTTTLTLNGINAGANTIGGALADNGSGKLAVAVGGSGLWMYSGSAKTYSGGTTVATGATLELAGSITQLSQSQNISNAGSLVVGGSANQNVGTLLGTGSATIGSGAALTAYQIRQSALTINGTGKVTLLASGAASTGKPWSAQ